MLLGLDSTPRHFTKEYYDIEKEYHQPPQVITDYFTDLGFDIIFMSTLDGDNTSSDKIDVNERTRRELLEEVGGDLGDLFKEMLEEPSESDKYGSNPTKHIFVAYNSNTNNSIELSFQFDDGENMSFGDCLIAMEQFKPHLDKVLKDKNVVNTEFSFIFIAVNKNKKMKNKNFYAAINLEIEYHTTVTIYDVTTVAFSKGDVKRMLNGIISTLKSTPACIEFIEKHGKSFK